jgi:hypothetical protein
MVANVGMVVVWRFMRFVTRFISNSVAIDKNLEVSK